MERLTNVQETLEDLGLRSDSSSQQSHQGSPTSFEHASDSSGSGSAAGTAGRNLQLSCSQTSKTRLLIRAPNPHPTQDTTTRECPPEERPPYVAAAERMSFSENSGNNSVETLAKSFVASSERQPPNVAKAERMSLSESSGNNSVETSAKTFVASSERRPPNVAAAERMSFSENSGNNSVETSGKSFVTSSSSSSLVSNEASDLRIIEGPSWLSSSSKESKKVTVALQPMQSDDNDGYDPPRLPLDSPSASVLPTSAGTGQESSTSRKPKQSKPITLPTISESVRSRAAQNIIGTAKHKPSSCALVAQTIPVQVPFPPPIVASLDRAIPSNSGDPARTPKAFLVGAAIEPLPVQATTPFELSASKAVDAPSLPSRRTTDLVPNNSHINIPPKTVMLNSSAFPPTLGLSQRQQQEPSPPTHPTNALPLATSTTTTLAVTVNAQNSPQPPQHSPTLSSSSTSSSNNKLSPHAPLRRGKWTMEEEAYVARVIQDFNSGFLSAPPGTTLRSYLSEKLHCDPMRITKKFTGDSCIGKRVFHPAVRCASNSITIDKAQTELVTLEQRWRRRLELQQRESAKKAAASAAAAAAAATGRSMGSHIGSHSHMTSVSSSPGGTTTTTTNAATEQQHGQRRQQPPPPAAAVAVQQAIQHKVVTRTASWLDRATAVLCNVEVQATSDSGYHTPAVATTSVSTAAQGATSPPIDGSDQLPSSTPIGGIDNSNSSSSPEEQLLEAQMNELRRLISEGPMIQQTTAGLPHLLHHHSSIAAAASGNEGGSIHLDFDDAYSNTAGQDEPEVPQVVQPTDKRQRRSTSPTASNSGNINIANNDSTSSGTNTDADAEALVGFLNSVRASAAAADGPPLV